MNTPAPLPDLPLPATRPRILVVEDEAIIACDIQQQLVKLGYEPVGHAVRGEQAIELTLELKPDLVLMDIQLAGDMDGVAACNAIRELVSLPVVFLTAFGEDHTFERAKLTDPFGYIIKPFSERELKATLEIALYKHGVEKKLKQQALALQEINRELTNQKFALDQHALVSSTDIQGAITYCNDKLCKISGYSREELLGQNHRRLNSGTHSKAFFTEMWKTITSGQVWQGEICNRAKNGACYWVNATIVPLLGLDGQPHSYIAIREDITERRLLESRLREGQKMQAIGTLAGGIAHDFNNILGAMFGYAHLLQQDTAGNPLAQESIEELPKSANRAKDLVRQMLIFSRQHEQKPQVIKLDPIVREAIKFLRASLPVNIQIDLELAPDTPAVLADPTQIYQVTMNLATNALHAMEDRPGCLTLRVEGVEPTAELRRAHPQLEAVQYVCLMVADTGQGMDAKTVERIFEPFFTTKPVGKGTGLGLAVVHGILHALGGVITVESQVGRGTTFRLYFPAQPQGVALTEAVGVEALHGEGEKILVVDDEPALTTVLHKHLTRMNYQPTTTNSPFEALRLLRENPKQFDMVITDLTMPEMNGVQLAEAIHAIQPDLPVILATGYAATLSPDTLREAAVKETIAKPMSPAGLAQAIRRNLRSQ